MLHYLEYLLIDQGLFTTLDAARVYDAVLNTPQFLGQLLGARGEVKQRTRAQSSESGSRKRKYSKPYKKMTVISE